MTSLTAASITLPQRIPRFLTQLLLIHPVPGPRQPLYCGGGSELLTYHPISAIGEGLGLNVTVVSYRDHLDYGLVACRELVPDLWHFKHLFGEGLEELKKAAERAIW